MPKFKLVSDDFRKSGKKMALHIVYVTEDGSNDGPSMSKQFIDKWIGAYNMNVDFYIYKYGEIDLKRYDM
jgi:hypothetical protein